MEFVIKPVKQEDLDRIYPEAEDAQIGKFTHRKREWPESMHHANWAVDERSGAFLLELPLSREDGSMKYLFGLDGGVAIIRNESYCLFSFLYVSDSLLDRMDHVKDLVREAFRVSGLMMDGKSADKGPDAVPFAQFVATIQEGA